MASKDTYSWRKNITKFFARSKHKTRDDTKDQAILYRDSMIEEHGLQSQMLVSAIRNRPFPTVRNKRNSSGVLGVTKAHWNGTVFWKAYGNIKSVRHQEYFTGDTKENFLSACLFRFKLHNELRILDASKMPCSESELTELVKTW